MTEPDGSASPSVRRVVLITLGAVALGVVLIGGGIGGYITYDRQRDKLAEARADRSDLRDEVERLTSDVSRQEAKARSEYQRGRTDGMRDQREINAEVGLDYNSGYNDAFEGFGQWQTDAYYIVFITRGEDGLKYNIERRTDMQPCTQYIIEGTSLFTRPESPC